MEDCRPLKRREKKEKEKKKEQLYIVIRCDIYGFICVMLIYMPVLLCYAVQSECFGTHFLACRMCICSEHGLTCH
jgi:hypothetical protein